jgi:carbamoyl-phosphate synthase large subunit
MNILITAASRRVPLVLAFKSAMRQLGLRGAVVVTDINPLSPAVYAADRAYSVPLSSDPSYLDELLAICERERVQLAVPTIDDELPLFGAARTRFGAVGTLAACSPESTASICNDKFLTAEHLRRAGVPAAATYVRGTLPKAPTFPLFIKPRSGRGSIGAFPIRSARELEFFLGYVENPVVQEYLEGPEYTIDVLCGFDGTPLSIVPRERTVIRSGVTDRGRTVASPALIDLATRVCAALPFGGPLNIQCRMRGGQPVVFEINARFSGGIPLTIAAGADFPAMLLQLAKGQTVQPQIGAFKDGLWITNYDTPLFLDSKRLRLSPLRDRRVLHPDWMAAEERIGEVA